MCGICGVYGRGPADPILVRAMADNVTVSGEDEGNFVSPSASASPSATGSATA